MRGLQAIADLRGDVTALTFGELPVDGGAILVINAEKLLTGRRKARDNAQQPDGPTGLPSHWVPYTDDLEVLVSGWVDLSGDPAATPGEEIIANVAALEAATTLAAEDNAGGVQVTAETRDGRTLTGPVQFDDFGPGRGVEDRLVFIRFTLIDPLVEVEED